MNSNARSPLRSKLCKAAGGSEFNSQKPVFKFTFVSLCCCAPLSVSTPAGRMRSDCVHHVPSGSLASEEPSGSGQLHLHDAATGTFLRVIPRCEEQEARPLFERDLLARQARARREAGEPQPRIVLAEEEDAAVAAAAASSSSSHSRHLLQFPSDYDGWEAYTEWYNADGIDVFLGSVGQRRRMRRPSCVVCAPLSSSSPIEGRCWPAAGCHCNQVFSSTMCEAMPWTF